VIYAVELSVNLNILMFYRAPRKMFLKKPMKDKVPLEMRRIVFHKAVEGQNSLGNEEKRPS
jgi:hypothetical protein